VKRRAFEPWLFVAPALIALALVALYPLAQTVYFAFTDARLGFASDAKFVGLTNFSVLFQDRDWWRAVLNTLAFCVVSVSLEIALGLGLALLIDQRFPGQGLVRASLLVPWAIPTVVSARMWSWMFNDLGGIVNATLLNIGLIDQPLAWIADRKLSFAAMVIVDVWKTTPFAALLLLAGLQSIPASVYEAARVDGASTWSRFWNITLPLLKPALVVTILFRMMDALRIFDLPFVLTTNSKESMVMSMFARQQLIDFQDVGYGSAASFLDFCIIGTLAILSLMASGREERAR
jgi:trehalose/maltose transport system permease protein